MQLPEQRPIQLKLNKFMKNLKQLKTLITASGLFLSVFCAIPACADGISDLRASLNRLQGQTPVKALLEVKNFRKRGEGKDAEEIAGYIQVGVEDNQRGLQISYSKEILNKIENEARAKAKDKESKTPTRNASHELESQEITMMLSAVPALQRQIDSAMFKGENPTATMESQHAS